MLWRTHFVMGLAAGYLVAGPEPVMLAAAGVASVLPDIDHPASKVGRSVPVVPTVTRIAFGHRGMLHSLLAALAVGLVVALVGGHNLGMAVFAGYLAHLVGDMLTPSGVPLLWPLPLRLRVPLVHTGGIIERLLVFPVAAVAVVIWVGKDVFHYFI
jgi:inner membrane protein